MIPSDPAVVHAGFGDLWAGGKVHVDVDVVLDGTEVVVTARRFAGKIVDRGEARFWRTSVMSVIHRVRYALCCELSVTIHNQAEVGLE